MRGFLAVPVLLLALGATPAHAAIGSRAADGPSGLTESVSTAHFLVHYTTATGDPNAITASAAQTVAANAEAAYAVEVGQWGYQAPVDDGDGHVDVSVFAFPPEYVGYAGMTWPISTKFPFAGSIWIDKTYTGSKSVVAHELFHLLQFGIFPIGKWVEEATARWAERQLGYDAAYTYLQHPDASLDCEYADCPAGTWDGGYNRWLFFGYLSDAYGRDIVREIFQTARAQWDSSHSTGSQTSVIDAVLQRHGSTLTRTFDEFAVANAAHSYPSVKGSGLVPTVPLTVGAAVASTGVTVDHLAAKYVDIGGAAGSTCASASLQVRVAMPIGLDSATLVVGASMTPLAVGDGTAAGVIAWTNCAKVLLVLPNGALSGGSATFAVQASVGGDLPPVRPPTPPTQQPPATSGGDPAPTLSLLGLPAVLTVSAKRPVLLLYVTANGPGKLAVSLDAAALGTFDLRPGVNAVRLAFPRGLKGRRMLVLTSLSGSGAQGQSLRQQLLFTR